MRALPTRFRAAEVEATVREFWRQHELPPPDDLSHAPPGGVTLWFGPLPGGEPLSSAVLERVVTADVAGRYFRMAGRAVHDPVFLRGVAPEGGAPDILAEFAPLGIWVGRGGLYPASSPASLAPLHAGIRALAERGALRAVSDPQRTCPVCRESRTPERTVYQEELRGVHVVRFPLKGRESPLSALVWTEAVWRLLGTEALLLHPDRAYVRARFQRHGLSEEILVAKSAIPRIGEWLPGGSLEILEERPGSQWAGTPYNHPLAAEMPSLAEAAPPRGTLVASLSVEDRGTGIVAIAPAHGPGDAALAQTLGLAIRCVVDPALVLTERPRHKYSGLPLDAGEACISRDLADDGQVFAEFRVVAGVPHCRQCGATLVWRPGRIWSLDLSKLSEATRERFEHLDLGDRFPEPSVLLPWPVSTGEPTTDPSDPELSECPACGRLAAPPGPEKCPCGPGVPTRLRRHILGALAEPLAFWSTVAPLPAGGSYLFLLPERRRTPSAIHQLVALELVGVKPGALRAVRIATLPVEGASESLARPPPADAVRAALLRLSASLPSRQPLAQAIVEESHRVYRLWAGTVQLLRRMSDDRYELDEMPVTAVLNELWPEDRALLSDFERTRLEVLHDYADARWAAGYLRLARFIAEPLAASYLPLIGPRLSAPRDAPEKKTLYRVLGHVLPRIAELAAPVMPHLSEAVHRAVRGDGRSVFQQGFSPVIESLIEPDSRQSLDRWGDLARAVRRARREYRFGPTQRFLQVVLIASREEEARPFRAHPQVLERLLGAEKVVICSPSSPWGGRRVDAHPNVEAIRRAYPNAYRRIVSLLGQIEGRRARELLRDQALAVALEGQPPLRIAPSMIEFTERVPERFVPLRWRYGEMFAELPPSAPAASVLAGQLPVEVERVRVHVAGRLRRESGTSRPAKLFVECENPLREELARYSSPLATALGVAEVFPVDSVRLFRSEETSHGRTRTGMRFRVWIPGFPVRRRPPKRRKPQPIEERQRLVTPRPPSEPVGPDILSEGVQRRTEAIHALLDELEGGAPLPFLGPTKLASAWDAGFQSRESLAQAELAGLGELPGFGPLVGRALIHALDPARALPPLPPLFLSPAPHAVVQTSLAAAETAVLPEPPAVAAETPNSAALPGPASVPEIESVAPPAPALPPPPPALYRPVRTVPVRAPPPVPEPLPPPPLEPVGRLDLPVGPSRDGAWEAFLDRLAGGAPGLWVGRLFPRALQLSGRDREVRYLWLSTSARPNSVRPGDLAALLLQLEAALRQGGVRAVLLEEVEYLVALNGLDAVRSFLAQLGSLAAETRSEIWVPIVPELLGSVTPEALVSGSSVTVPPVADGRAPTEPGPTP